MQYERFTHIEHVLKRPDSYVGSLPPEPANYWVRDGLTFKIHQLSTSPGLVKIFDEILVNAIDQYSTHPKKVTQIKIDISSDGSILVENSGVSIPIKKHEMEMAADGSSLWIPELIFGHLLTSSNYNDDEKRVTGGRNGYGAKLANIFSSKFWIKISDGKKIYSQVWHKNMSKCETPILETKSEHVYVQIGFTPDWPRFGGLGDFMKVAEKRAWDAAMWCSKANLYFNSKLLEVKSLEEYASMHGLDSMAKMHTENFDIVIGHSSSGAFQQCSWVNGISTPKGGSHVDKLTGALVAELSKDKRVTVKPTQIKSTLFVFVRATVINPTFSSQTKAECTSRISEIFDFKPKFIKDVLGSGVLDELMALGAAKVDKELKKTDGSKKSRITGIPKLDDANWAGTHKSHECTLIITEGDSAKALAIAGLGVVGRNSFGVFPLRGKPRNVRDATIKQVTENEEFSNLKKILGLQHGKVYTSLKDLRYGRLMIMTDADLDGSHIKGLVLNMFHVYWPSLIGLGFVVSMVTPVIKAGKTWYFTEEAFKEAVAGQPAPSGTKYYKGLGTSTSAEAKEYFKQIDRLTVAFSADPNLDESMRLAFAKALADDRKEWLTQHMAAPPRGIQYGSVKTLSVSDFIHRDLSKFSAEDIKRSIPHVSDGLKPSQRKVVYACLKKNLTTDMKVAQLAGYVAEHTAYHHGEASLQGTIVNLAQNFVGANNLNLLEPSGQFGTRLAGGKDAASSRYIFTRLSPWTKKLFDPSDNSVLKYVVDDGEKVEPEFYSPILPMILINGAEGIGTGFSCYVPPFDGEAVKHNILCALDQVAMIPMKPYFKGFKGKMTKTKDHTWVMEGVVSSEGSQLHITELPPGKWIQDFKEHLEDLLEKGVIQKYENHSSETTPDFRVWGFGGDDPIKELGLTKTIHTSNMYLIGPNGAVKKYASPEEILVDYIDIRIAIYKKRKTHLLKVLDTEIQWLSEKARFIGFVIHKRIQVLNIPLEDIHAQLRSENFREELWTRLLDIKTYQYTREEVLKLKELCAAKNLEREQLKATSVVQMWKNNLRDL
jgi:DNA topoisomerase-2